MVTVADRSAQELADLVIAESRERPASAAILEHADLEVIDGHRSIGPPGPSPHS